MDVLGIIGTVTGVVGLLVAVGSLWIAYRADTFTREQAKEQDKKIAQYRAEDNRPELGPVANRKPQFIEGRNWLVEPH